MRIRLLVTVLLLGFASHALASKVIPPGMIVEWLIKAVQEGNTEEVARHFTFEKEKHKSLSPLSRDEQLQLLKDIPLDKMVFEKGKYAIEDGKQFVIRLVAPKKLDFEIEHVQLDGDLGPPWNYVILAVRETAQPSGPGDAKPVLPPEQK